MDKVRNGFAVLAEPYLREIVLVAAVLLDLIHDLGLAEGNDRDIEGPGWSFLLVGRLEMLLPDERKAQIDHVHVVALLRGHGHQVVVQLLLILLVQCEHDLSVLELRRGKLKLAHLEGAAVVYHTQGVVIRTHLEPVNIREHALRTKTETSLALLVAVVSADGEVVEYLLKRESRFVVCQLDLSLVQELDHHLDVVLFVVAAAYVLKKLSDDGLPGVVVHHSSDIYRASARIHVVEVILERRTVNLAGIEHRLDLLEYLVHALPVAGSVALKEVTKELFDLLVVFAHKYAPFLRTF